MAFIEIDHVSIRCIHDVYYNENHNNTQQILLNSICMCSCMGLPFSLPLFIHH
jgi:hypothetical protein